LSQDGVDTVWTTVLDHRQRMQNSGEFDLKRRAQALDWLQALVDEGLRERFLRHPQIRRQFPKYRQEVARGEMSPTVAAGELLFFLDNPKSP
jgi:LAO/AO transport system kinase